MAINIPQKPRTPTPELRNGPMTRRDRINAMVADEANASKGGGKIGSIVFFVLIEFTIVGFAIVSDLIGIILLIFGADDFFILDIINLAVFAYFYVKKVDMTPMYIPSLIELIPWIGALPMRTVGICGTIILDKWPDSGTAKMLKTLGMVGKKISGGKGTGAPTPKVPATK